MNTQLQNHVKAIADDIHNGTGQPYCDHCDEFHAVDFEEDETPCPDCGEVMKLQTLSGYDYLEDALDIEYYVASDKTYLGRVSWLPLVAPTSGSIPSAAKSRATGAVRLLERPFTTTQWASQMQSLNCFTAKEETR